MKSLFIFNIQSFSDVITNSSSELFIINNTDDIVHFIRTLYKQYKNNNKWNNSGSDTGCKIYSIVSDYESDIESTIELYVGYGRYSADELDKLFELFGDVIEYDQTDNGIILINCKDLSIDRYIELRNFIDKTDKLTRNTIFLEIDHDNKDFIKELKNAGINLEFI